MGEGNARGKGMISSSAPDNREIVRYAPSSNVVTVAPGARVYPAGVVQKPSQKAARRARHRHVQRIVPQYLRLRSCAIRATNDIQRQAAVR